MTNKPAYVSRLGLHHFAHLRAVAEGLPVVDAAKRYLGVEHGHQAKVAHLETRDAVRAVARRRGLSAWRLIGMTFDGTAPQVPNGAPPGLQEFIEARDLDDWSEADVLQMYQELYPANGKQLRRQRVRARLRERLLDTLHELEALAAEQPQPADAISGWFDAITAAKLLSADMVILAQLQERIVIGGRWWRDLPGVGRTKAHRIESHLTMLLSEQPQPKPRVVFSLSKRVKNPSTPSDILVAIDSGAPSRPVGNDKQAIEAWVAAKAGSAATVKAYTREAIRLLLWLNHERGGSSFGHMTLLDCRDYMAFLQHIPAHWMSRVRAQPCSPGWAPFRGPLSTRSVRQTITIVVSMFHWLQASGYIAQNPWLLVNQKIGDDRQERVLQSKALSEVATREVIAFCQNKLPEPAAQRMLFIVQFVTSVGLRSAELLSAKLADVQHEEEGWVMQVHGKGSKNRIVALPPAALQALNTYLQARGLGDITSATPQAPVLASLQDPLQGVGYQALYQHVKSWLGKAIDVADLPTSERMRLRQASTHWLRHTFGTRAIAKEVPLDVIQAQMGHASIQTTTAIYGRAPMRRRIDEMDRAFG